MQVDLLNKKKEVQVLKGSVLTLELTEPFSVYCDKEISKEDLESLIIEFMLIYREKLEVTDLTFDIKETSH